MPLYMFLSRVVLQKTVGTTPMYCPSQMTLSYNVIRPTFVSYSALGDTPCTPSQRVIRYHKYSVNYKVSFGKTDYKVSFGKIDKVSGFLDPLNPPIKLHN